MCNKYYQCKMCRKIKDNLFDKILEEEINKLEKEQHGK